MNPYPGRWPPMYPRPSAWDLGILADHAGVAAPRPPGAGESATDLLAAPPRRGNGSASHDGRSRTRRGGIAPTIKEDATVDVRRLAWAAALGLSQFAGSAWAAEPSRLPLPLPAANSNQELAESLAARLKASGLLKDYRVDVS